MACAWRAVGREAGVRGTQRSPFHDQVSSSLEPLPERSPPNRTISPLWASNAIAWLARARGEVDGFLAVQVEPSQSQVSPRVPASLRPPKSTQY